jgi:hypothetical protein
MSGCDGISSFLEIFYITRAAGAGKKEAGIDVNYSSTEAGMQDRCRSL